MSVNSWIRRQFKNNVAITDTIPTGMTSGAMSFTAADGSTFPDGSVGPFIVTVDQGLATEEKIQCSSRSGSVFTVNTNGRGYNGGGTAQNHGTNATLFHTIDQQDLDEANQVAVQTLGAITASGDLLQGSGTNALTKLARGAANSFLQVQGSSLGYVAFPSSNSTTTVAATNSDGTSTAPARYDHVHVGVASFNTRKGAVTSQASDVEGLFTADQQIFSGTGNGTGELIDLLAALKEYFASAGQLITGTGAGTGELLAAGAANSVLTVAGADPSTLSWAQPVKQLIASTVLGSPATNITFSSIPSTFQHLELEIMVRSSVAATSDALLFQLNGDTGNNYDVQLLQGAASTASASSSSAIAGGSMSTINGNNGTAGEASYCRLFIPYYAGTTFRKQCLGETGTNDAQAIVLALVKSNTKWRSTAAINAIKLFPNTGPNFVTGTTARLYGIG